ncbi:acyl-CoA dehydrogenase family protein [Phreatobacter stygius]|uniref:3-sulfinopropanoyl-CoA desulfinase n=1 Tax=Phreatobacter stygius TaxID=1940610 RepID=A0A4D7B4S3_9HYPH|nr:acyl-CoA dehydrogenase family protein [Phreatobacter stygius]QCI64686.1 acyl-CoA dehydrogenase [Phreatobacter stygius]
MLTETQKQIRDVARQFAQKELAPGAAERDRAVVFPEAALKAMGRLGLMGIMIDEAHGGAGADYVAFAQAVTEIAAADGACSTVMQVHNGLVCMGIARYASTAQKERFLVPLARGEALGCFCLTEPEAGSDAAAIRTTARRRGNHFVLNGAKQFITSGSSSDTAIVFAVTDPAAGKKGLTAFIVPTTTPGYQVARIEHTMGQRSTDHCHIVFEDCEVPADHMLGEEGEGLRIALSNLEGGRIGVAAQSLGMARAAYEAALRYARERRTFGKPIIEHQAVAFRLADMATALDAAELMTWRAATLRDAGAPCLKEASMAKLFASEAAERICNDAIQTLGGYGYLEDFPVERIYRDVRVCTIYEGTSDIQRLVISRQIAG